MSFGNAKGYLKFNCYIIKTLRYTNDFSQVNKIRSNIQFCFVVQSSGFTIICFEILRVSFKFFVTMSPILLCYKIN